MCRFSNVFCIETCLPLPSMSSITEKVGSEIHAKGGFHVLLGDLFKSLKILLNHPAGRITPLLLHLFEQSRVTLQRSLCVAKHVATVECNRSLVTGISPCCPGELMRDESAAPFSVKQFCFGNSHKFARTVIRPWRLSALASRSVVASIIANP